MSTPRNIAEADRLTIEATALWRDSQALTIAEYRAQGLDTHRIHPDVVCAAGRPLRERATALRARARELRQLEADAVDIGTVRAAGSTITQATIGTAIADAVAGLGVAPATPTMNNGNPSTMTQTEFDAAVATAVAAALASMPPAAGAAKADPKAAAEEQRKLEEDAVAARIVGGDCTAAQITAQRHASEIRAAERAEEEGAAEAEAGDAATLAARIAAA